MNVYDAIVIGLIALTWLASVKMVCSAVIACAGIKKTEADVVKAMFEEGRKHGL